MAGGIFTSQNKARPGAYINFKSVSSQSNGIGDRGIVTMPLPMIWGAEDTIINIYSNDITTGKALDKIGLYGYEAEAQIIREALKNSYMLLAYRLDSGGQNATGDIGTLTAVAKYPGEFGNRISIQVKERGAKFDVNTLIDSRVVDIQTVSTVSELVSNDWVDFAGTGALTANAGTKLSAGANGTIKTESYGKYLEKIKTKVFNTMGIYTTNDTIKGQVVEFIKQLREIKGKKVQVVINDYAQANYEGVISVDQGYKTLTETVPLDSFVSYVAGLTAGSGINKSNTYNVIDGAIEIINPKTDEELESEITKGKLLISYRQDESVIIESDINTLCEYGDDKGKEFSKNRVIRTLDDINNTVKLKFEKSFIGKIDNTDEGRNMLKSDIISYLSELQRMSAIKDFVAEDVTVAAGDNIDSVVIDLAVKPVDSMEKLYMTVSVG